MVTPLPDDEGVMLKFGVPIIFFSGFSFCHLSSKLSRRSALSKTLPTTPTGIKTMLPREIIGFFFFSIAFLHKKVIWKYQTGFKEQ
jgi:hypothetical protein